MLNGLDLFSGIGGITLALAPWVRPVAYCERDPYCQGVLLSRIAQGQLPVAPIWDDICTLSEPIRDTEIDIVYGGFPCQDISAAGAGVGLGGERSGLFFELVRVIEETRPTFVFLENVPAIRTRGLARVCFELARLGFDLRWTTVSAGEVGATHRRQRWFLLAHANGERLERLELHEGPWAALAGVADLVQQAVRQEDVDQLARIGDELPRPMDQVRALGNAVVPAQAREAFMRLSGLKMRGLSGLRGKND